MAQIHPCDFYFVVHSRLLSSILSGAEQFLLPQVKSGQDEAWACSVILGRTVLSRVLLALTSLLPIELHSLGY